jgi:uncharacterized protein with PIN domain
MITILANFQDKLVIRCPCGVEFTEDADKVTPKTRCPMCTTSLKRKSRGQRAKADEYLQKLFDVFYNVYNSLSQEDESWNQH